MGRESHISLKKMDENISGVSCNLIGVMRRCFYTGFLAEAEEMPAKRYDTILAEENLRRKYYSGLFKDFTSDDSDEEVLYEQKQTNKVYEDRKETMEQKDTTVMPKETTLLLHEEGKLKEEERDTILILNEIDEVL